jgi:hypothetical protein
MFSKWSAVRGILHPSLFTLVLLLFSIFLTGCKGDVSEPISLEEAIQLVLDAVVKPDDLEGEVIVFSWAEPLTAEDTLQPYLGSDLESPGEAILIENESWFFWVEDYPGAAFAHPNRFALVDRVTHEVSVSNQNWWPLINGEGVWVDTDVYWDEANWAFSNVDWRPTSAKMSMNSSPLAKIVSPSLLQGGLGVALVVNGWDDGQTVKEDMQENAGGMIGALSQAGFDTTYHGPPGDRHIDNIDNWILDQSFELQPSQTALIYVTGHGAQVDQKGQIKVGREWLREDDLADWLKRFRPGVHILVILDACYSGSFTDGLREYADITVTSTGPQDVGYADYDPDTDPNPDDQGTEFSSGFIEDWIEIISDPDEVERVRKKGEERGDNFWEALVSESYLSALEKDATYQGGWTFPQLLRGLPGTRPPTPIPEPQVSFVDEHQDTRVLKVDELIEEMELSEEDKAALLMAYLLDPGGDWIYSILGVDPGKKEPQTDMIGSGSGTLRMDQQAVDSFFNESLFPCGEMNEGWFTVCAYEAGPVPVGDVYMLYMVLDADIPLADPENYYIYSAVFDADGDPANNFQAQPPYNWDYFQGTDRWYQLAWAPDMSSWYLDVTDLPSQQWYTAPSNARAVIFGNLIVFFIPADEFSVENPPFRMSTFIHDSTYLPEVSSGDVIGDDPTQPLSDFVGEPIVIEGGLE